MQRCVNTDTFCLCLADLRCVLWRGSGYHRLTLVGDGCLSRLSIISNFRFVGLVCGVSLKYFLLLFIVMPIAELWLLITVGQSIGVLPTIGLVLLTAVIGLSLLQQQGGETLLRARGKMKVGEMPAIEMLEGMVLGVCGALLLTPGFVTDTVGFLGLVPPVRRWLIMHSGMMSKLSGNPQSSPMNDAGQGQVLDAEYWEEQSHSGSNGDDPALQSPPTEKNPN